MTTNQALMLRYQKALKAHDAIRRRLLEAANTIPDKAPAMTTREIDALYDACPAYVKARGNYLESLNNVSAIHHLCRVAGLFGPMFSSEEKDDE